MYSGRSRPAELVGAGRACVGTSSQLPLCRACSGYCMLLSHCTAGLLFIAPSSAVALELLLFLPSTFVRVPNHCCAAFGAKSTVSKWSELVSFRGATPGKCRSWHHKSRPTTRCLPTPTTDPRCSFCPVAIMPPSLYYTAGFASTALASGGIACKLSGLAWQRLAAARTHTSLRTAKIDSNQIAGF